MYDHNYFERKTLRLHPLKICLSVSKIGCLIRGFYQTCI